MITDKNNPERQTTNNGFGGRMMESRERLNTPYFLIRTEIVDKLVNDMLLSLKKRWANGIAGYSFKTNNLPWILTYMKDKGLWAEVVSSDEYQLAKELGYTPSQIIFNGPVKRKDEFVEAVEEGAIVNIDSKRELEWLLACDLSRNRLTHIGLRVNFCIEEFCAGESQCGNEDGRFGFSYETGDLKNAIEFLVKHQIPLSGLHLHCSSKTRSLNIYKAIADMTVQIVHEYNLHLQYVDIGGGFFGGVTGKPDFEDYFGVVYEIFSREELLKDVNLIVEPGMSVIGAAIEYVTTVVDTKNTKNNKFVLLDGSRIHIDPLMKKSGYSYRIERDEAVEKQDKTYQILCGFTCMEGDRFFELYDSPLAADDLVIFEKVGAYTMGLSPQFIEFYPAVYAEIGDQIVLARPKNTATYYIR